MKRKKFGAFLCVLGLVLLLPGPEPVRTAGAPAEVTLDSPPLVALTFDDGPRSSTTGPLLDGLALREVPATFFLVGNRIPGNEDLVRRMAAEGHQIGIHTYDHVELKGLSRQDFDLQVGKTRALIVSLLPLTTLVPVFLKITLPDGVRMVWAICNIVLALAGLLLSVICVKSEESRSVVNIMSTVISVALVLMMLGIVALALVLNFLK